MELIFLRDGQRGTNYHSFLKFHRATSSNGDVRNDLSSTSAHISAATRPGNGNRLGRKWSAALWRIRRLINPSFILPLPRPVGG